MTRQTTIILAPLCVLAGCTALGGAESGTTMRLAPAVAASPVGTSTVRVAMGPVTARGLAGDRRYTYVLAGDPRVMRQAATLFWEEAPTNVIRRNLNETLEARGMSSGDAAMQLIVTVTRFEEVSDAPRADAVVSIDAELTTRSDRQFLGPICSRATIANASGSARADAFERAISAVDAQLANRLAGQTPVTPGSC